MIAQLLPEEQRSQDRLQSGDVYVAAAGLQGEHALPRRSWPELLHFEDLNDITTAAFVPLVEERYRYLPGTPTRSMESLFGDNARIEGIYAEIARDGVPNRIERLLPWIAGMNGANGRTRVGRDNAFWQNLVFGNFILDGVSQ
ncbi:MAG: hypothetical protein K2P58_15795 [Hyphomonadaceae bacterium]|nr:hypothetical protein [Hyphomonadaceae bacterium]